MGSPWLLAAAFVLPSLLWAMRWLMWLLFLRWVIKNRPAALPDALQAAPAFHERRPRNQEAAVSDTADPEWTRVEHDVGQGAAGLAPDPVSRARPELALGSYLEESPSQ